MGNFGLNPNISNSITAFRWILIIIIINYIEKVNIFIYIKSNIISILFKSCQDTSKNQDNPQNWGVETGTSGNPSLSSLVTWNQKCLRFNVLLDQCMNCYRHREVWPPPPELTPTHSITNIIWPTHIQAPEPYKYLGRCDWTPHLIQYNSSTVHARCLSLSQIKPVCIRLNDSDCVHNLVCLRLSLGVCIRLNGVCNDSMTVIVRIIKSVSD